MKRPRISIAMLMALIILAAFNLALARCLLDVDGYILAAIVSSALTIQLAVIQLIRTRHVFRAFWTGFIAGLTVTAGLCFWGMLQDRRLTPGFDPALGKRFVYWTPGNPMWPGWPSYRRHAYRVIASSALGRSLMDRYDVASLPVLTVVMFLPQLLVGLVTGFLALLIASVLRMLRFPPHPSRRSLFRRQTSLLSPGNPARQSRADEIKNTASEDRGGRWPGEQHVQKVIVPSRPGRSEI